MTRAAIYVRVSSARQAEEGLSLPEQERRCREFVNGRDWSLVHVYIERGISGAKARRPALDQLMRSVHSGELDAVVTPKIDRLGRNARHNLELFEHFDDADVIVYSPDGRDHQDRFIRTIESAVAEREREAISERVRAVTPAKRARGSYNGGPRPYGYTFGPDGLEVRQDEADIVRRMFSAYLAGKSLRGIARSLNEDGVTGPLGGAWTQARIAERLDAPLYAGQVAAGHVGRHEAIIDAETWDRARELRDTTAHRAGRGSGGHTRSSRRANHHLLGGGLLRCECGSSMYPRKDTRSGRDTYRCRSRDERINACTMPPLPRDHVDAAVRAWLAAEVLSPGMAEGDIEREVQQAAKDATRIAAVAEREVSKVEAQLRNGKLRMLEDEPPFSPAEWQELRAELEPTLTTAKARASDHHRAAEALRRPSTDLLGAVNAIRRAVADEAGDLPTLAAQQAAIGRLFECFEIVSGPSDAAAPPKRSDDEEAVALAQERELGEFDGPTPFTVKARGLEPRAIYLVPSPWPALAERFAGTPLDSMRELAPTVRQGFPIR